MTRAGPVMMTTDSRWCSPRLNWNSVRTVTVKGVADNLSDGDQDYAIVLTGDSSSTDLRFRNVDPADVSVRNLDYTTKGGFYVSQISGDTDENLNTAFFTVSLSSAPSSDNVTITMATSDSGEGVISNVTGGTGNDDNSTLVFTSSDWNSVRTVTVKGVADNLSDGDQDYAIVLTGDSSSTDLRFRNVDPADVSVRNLDYTTKGGFYVSQISGDTDENLNTAFFTVSLSSAPSSDNVTITMATSDSGEGVISNVTGGTGNDDNSTLVFTSSELELGADGDGERCCRQLIGRRPGLRDCVDGRQFQYGSSLQERGSCGCFGAKSRLHDQRRLLRFSDLRGYR